MVRAGRRRRDGQGGVVRSAGMRRERSRTAVGSRDGARKLRVDRAAATASPGVPAFAAPPKGAPAYHGFPLVAATRTDGWCYGAITEFEDPAGCTSGDGFVEAPDGSRAGLVWSVGNAPMKRVCAADARRWGVFAVSFPQPVRTTEDLAICFRAVLPGLRAIFEKRRRSAGANSRRH